MRSVGHLAGVPGFSSGELIKIGKVNKSRMCVYVCVCVCVQRLSEFSDVMDHRLVCVY